MLSWIDLIEGAVVTQTIALVIRSLLSHYQHKDQNRILEEILNELRPKG